MANVGRRPGPPPKRNAERAHHGPPAGGAAIEFDPTDLSQLPFEIDLMVEPPEADPAWHARAKMIYSLLLVDPARIWMGPADWGLSWLICENLSRQLNPQVVGIVEGGYDAETGETVAGHVAREIVPLKGTDINGLLKWAQMIGITEQGRMGLRKEITFHEQPRAVESNTSQLAPTREGWFDVIEGGKAVSE